MIKTKIDFHINNTEFEKINQYTLTRYDIEDYWAEDYETKEQLRDDIRNYFYLDKTELGVVSDNFDQFWEQVEKLKPNHTLYFQTITHYGLNTERPFDNKREWSIRRNF